MKIGTQTAILDKAFGPNKALDIIKKVGFESVDYSLMREELVDMSYGDLKKHFSTIKNHADQLDLPIVQTHTPFYNYNTMLARYDEIIEIQKKALMATAYLGAKYAIVHPLMPPERIYDQDYDRTKELNMKYYSALIPSLKEHDIFIAVENMFAVDPYIREICPTTCTTAEEMVDYIDSLGERFVACLDVGHANLIHQEGYEHVNQEHMIKTLGHRLQTLHLHDNDGKSDQHFPPYMGTIDWDLVMRSLKEINYPGVLMLECDILIKQMYPEFMEMGKEVYYAAVKRLADISKKY